MTLACGHLIEMRRCLAEAMTVDVKKSFLINQARGNFCHSENLWMLPSAFHTLNKSCAATPAAAHLGKRDCINARIIMLCGSHLCGQAPHLIKRSLKKSSCQAFSKDRTTMAIAHKRLPKYHCCSNRSGLVCGNLY